MNTAIASLVNTMSLHEQVGQLNQHMFGWEAIQRNKAGKLEASDALKREIDRWGGLGLLYGLFRADPWSGQHWGNGILPQERLEAVNIVQETVKTRGNHGIGVLLSEEAPHGHQALGGTVLPTNLALGATWDPTAVMEAQQQVSAELFNSGVHLALVSGLDIARDPRWGRSEECFGEDPYLASRMCTAIVEGMQGDHRCRVGNGGVAVVLKHLAAQGEAMGGRNGGSAVIGRHDLHEIHLPMVRAAIDAGVTGFMAAYNDIDGVPCCANSWLLKTYLREQHGFDGIVMADGLAVDRLASLTGNTRAAGRTALLSGVDVSLWDEGFTQLSSFANDKQVCQAVRQAVTRVLTLKHEFGLLPDTLLQESESAESASNTTARATAHCTAVPSYDQWQQAHREGQRCSEQLAQQCLTLLHNTAVNTDTYADQDITPLDQVRNIMRNPSSGNIIVAGTLADDLPCFLGDYTAPQQQSTGGIYSALVNTLDSARVKIVNDEQDLDNADWANAGVVIHVVGDTSERSYTSSFAANGAAANPQSIPASCGEGVDMADVQLPWNQSHMATAIATHAQSHSIPVVTVTVCGRAHVMEPVFASSDVILWTGYAGPFGPQAVARALIQTVPIPGRINVTIPSNHDVLPLHYNDRHSAHMVYKDAPHPIRTPFNTGLGSLSYATLQLQQAWIDEASQELVLECFAQAPDPSNTAVAPEYIEGSFNVFAHIEDGVHVPRELVLIYSQYLRMQLGTTHTWQARVQLNNLLIGDESPISATIGLQNLSITIDQSCNMPVVRVKFWVTADDTTANAAPHNTTVTHRATKR